MKRSVAVSLLALAMLLVAPTVGHAQHRGGGGGGGFHGGSRGGGFHGGGFHHHDGGFRGEVFIGPGWGGWPYYDPFWYPGWYYPPAYYRYPPAYYAPDAPQSYVEQEPEPPPPPQAFWYYCAPSRAYYPKVRECPEDWVKVPARPPAN